MLLYVPNQRSAMNQTHTVTLQVGQHDLLEWRFASQKEARVFQDQLLSGRPLPNVKVVAEPATAVDYRERMNRYLSTERRTNVVRCPSLLVLPRRAAVREAHR